MVAERARPPIAERAAVPPRLPARYTSWSGPCRHRARDRQVGLGLGEVPGSAAHRAPQLGHGAPGVDGLPGPPYTLEAERVLTWGWLKIRYPDFVLSWCRHFQRAGRFP